MCWQTSKLSEQMWCCPPRVPPMCVCVCLLADGGLCQDLNRPDVGAERGIGYVSACSVVSAASTADTGTGDGSGGGSSSSRGSPGVRQGAYELYPSFPDILKVCGCVTVPVLLALYSSAIP